MQRCSHGISHDDLHAVAAVGSLKVSIRLGILMRNDLLHVI